MAQQSPDLRLFRHPSTESSPPPSPTIPATPTDMKLRKQASLPLLSASGNRSETQPNRSFDDARPRFVGVRNETPPSPPDSVFLQNEASTSASPKSQDQGQGHRRNRSLRDRITSVFRGRRESNASSSNSAGQRHYHHKAENSASTNATTGLARTITTDSTEMSMPPSPLRPQFYAEEEGRRKRVMRGGEVKVEIQPPPIEYDEPERPVFNPQYWEGHHLHPDAERPSLEENPAHSERKYSEAAAESFADFHFGLPENTEGYLGTSRVPSMAATRSSGYQGEFGFAIPGPMRQDTDSSILTEKHPASSGKASSNVLTSTKSDINVPMTTPPLPRTNRNSGSTGGRSSVLGRPSTGRAYSATSFIGDAEGLKRLSKMSGLSGSSSGVSGVAIVVTADGAASSRLVEESDSEYERRPTWEEKGKGVARPSSEEQWGIPSMLSVQDDPHSESPSQLGDDSDSRDSALQGKLRSQVPDRDTLVHQADPRYEHVYHMRQTSDERPILVPQYQYAPTCSFPNINAMTLPLRAKTAGRQSIPSFASSYTNDASVNLKMPSPALTRPDRDSFAAVMRGAHDRESYAGIPSHDGGRDSYSSRDSHRVTLETLGLGYVPSTDSDRKVAFTETLPEPPSDFSSRFHASFAKRPAMARRSVTPHLWAPRDLDEEKEGHSRHERMEHVGREQKVGRFLLAACLVFPPMLFVLACGGFDSFMPGLTKGECRGVGRTEKRIAMVLGTLVNIGALVGIVVGVAVAVS